VPEDLAGGAEEEGGGAPLLLWPRQEERTTCGQRKVRRFQRVCVCVVCRGGGVEQIYPHLFCILTLGPHSECGFGSESSSLKIKRDKSK
jgi:hypothetical protein